MQIAGSDREDILALQLHCEMTASMVREWCARYRRELVETANQAGVQSEAEMLNGIDLICLGPKERSLGTFDPAAVGWLEEIYAKRGIRLYEVRSRDRD